MPLRRIKVEELAEPPDIRQRVPLSSEFPELAAMWHKAKNKKFTADQFSVGSNIEVWFKCPEGPEHVFQKAISSMVLARRKGASGCPACKGDLVTKSNSLLKRFPKIAREYSSKNIVPIDEISYGSSRRAYWECGKCNHEWQTAISNRTQLASSCPNCRNAPVINLKTAGYINFFNKRANKGIDPERVPVRRPVWWHCKVSPDHTWKAAVNGKLTNKREFCPFCRGNRASLTNNLTLAPELTKQFHPKKNGKLKPTDISLRSFKVIWWKCKEGPDHEWAARVYERTFDGAGCPFCRNHRLSVTNNLQKMAPQIAKEWHPTKNEKLTPKDVVAFTTKPAWFLCPAGHSYQKSIHLRMRFGVGCPQCRQEKSGVRMKKIEDRASRRAAKEEASTATGKSKAKTGTRTKARAKAIVARKSTKARSTSLRKKS
jgi:Zn finger protein HypA/HybF involved in hydrogenase expression